MRPPSMITRSGGTVVFIFTSGIAVEVLNHTLVVLYSMILLTTWHKLNLAASTRQLRHRVACDRMVI